MSVRERIAGFGGSGAANFGGKKDAPAWATQQRLHSAKPAAAGAYGSPAAVDSSKTSSRAFSVPGAIGQDPAPARNIKVPGAFQNVSEGTDDGPVRTADVQHSLLPDKRGVTGTASAASWSGADGSSSALAPATVETKLRPPSARPFTTLPSSSGATSSNKKRDVFGLMSAPEATSSVPAVAPGLATAEDGGGVNGTLKEMDGQQGRARSTAKKQTGPRRLLVAGKGKQAISAEKQRAALGLDKDKSDDDDAPANDDVARKPCRRKQTPAVSAAVTTVRAASGHDNKTNERMPSSYNSSIKRAPVARVQQDQARGGSHAGIPNVSSLRSSGHTLW